MKKSEAVKIFNPGKGLKLGVLISSWPSLELSISNNSCCAGRNDNTPYR
jgi:hypothetical protein